jgi:hypothetical protein
MTLLNKILLQKLIAAYLANRFTTFMELEVPLLSSQDIATGPVVKKLI